MTKAEVTEKLKDMHALLTDEDKETLWKYAKDVPAGGHIVDIGTAAGGSAFWLTLSSDPGVSVLTIDPQENKTFKENLERMKLWTRLKYWKMTSSDAALAWNELPVDLLFIDGIHSYTGVKDDLRDWGKFVRKGGIILAHDYFLHADIAQALEESAASGFMDKITVVDSLYQGEKRIGMFVGRKL